MMNIDGNGMHNTMTIDHASTAPSRSERHSTTLFKTSKDPFTTDIQEPERTQPQSPQEYDAICLVGHKKVDLISVERSDDTDTITGMIPINLRKANRSLLYMLLEKKTRSQSTKKHVPQGSQRTTYFSPSTTWTSATRNLRIVRQTDKKT